MGKILNVCRICEGIRVEEGEGSQVTFIYKKRTFYRNAPTKGGGVLQKLGTNTLGRQCAKDITTCYVRL